MPYVIGQSSILKVFHNGGSESTLWKGILSFSFNESKGFNPLYQLSNNLASHRSVYAVEANSSPTASITMYSGYKESGTKYPNSHAFDTTDEIDCDDSPLWVSIEFTPGLCVPFSDWNINRYDASTSSSNSYGKFFISSYSFSKEAQGFGQESWSFQAKPRTSILISSSSPGSFQNVMDSTVIQDEIDLEDIHMVSGVVTGSVSGDFDEYNYNDSEDYLDRAGIDIAYNSKTNTSQPSPGSSFVKDKLASKSVESSAGALSLGRANVSHSGFVSEIGGSTLIRKDGISVNANATVPLTPVYQVKPT